MSDMGDVGSSDSYIKLGKCDACDAAGVCQLNNEPPQTLLCPKCYGTGKDRVVQISPVQNADLIALTANGQLWFYGEAKDYWRLRRGAE